MLLARVKLNDWMKEEYYEITDIGLALLQNPSLSVDIQRTIAEGGAWEVKSGRIIKLQKLL